MLGCTSEIVMQCWSADQPNRREKGYKKLRVLDVRGNQRLAYPPPSYLLRAEEIGEYLEKLKEVSVR